MTYREAKAAFQQKYWTDLLRRYGGNIHHVAAAAGCNRTWLYKKLKLGGIDINSYRGRELLKHCQKSTHRGNWAGLH